MPGLVSLHNPSSENHAALAPNMHCTGYIVQAYKAAFSSDGYRPVVTKRASVGLVLMDTHSDMCC